MDATEPFMRDDVRTFLAMVAGMNRPDIASVPIEQTRTMMAAMQEFIQLPGPDLAVVKDLAAPGPHGTVPLRLYDPRAERGPSPLLLFIHGGGFVAGDIASYDATCRTIAAEMDLPLVSVEYRLAPEHPFPAAPEDCEAAARWLATSPAELGREVTGLIPLGDSAGGNLAIVVTQSLMLEPAAVPVLMQAPIYPVTDPLDPHPSYAQFAEGHLLTRSTMDYFNLCYALDPEDRRAYPILGPIAGTPPTVLATAALDPLRDSGRAYASALVQAGSDVTYLELAGNIHGFIQIRKAIPSAHADLLAILGAMKATLERIA
ncbi:alpha/beta hydrolase [Altererythrobacter sp. CC-YST694]|uniref:alpha/beta hydrolase n=1 Tax=Altererythrobacter sp. CC-YST694 TaxID=2755038 RepID=UPI001D01AEAC|nr:alpha/beta hydrolase [Altererythrobacter sp. CC-YST694]MCB5424321.1 alpha/beta hydrolase [Altererythrobacter sp. CC-YST694]